MTADILGIIEVILIGLTAIVTIATAIYVGKQANHHFRMQRSTRFIERFNTGDLLRIRPRVDRLLLSQPDWPQELAEMKAGKMDEERRLLFYDLVVFTNFFQELATAFEHNTIAEKYTWDVFGLLLRHYWRQLQPYVLAMRKAHERPTLYEGFERIAGRMHKFDGKHNRR